MDVKLTVLRLLGDNLKIDGDNGGYHRTLQVYIMIKKIPKCLPHKEIL